MAHGEVVKPMLTWNAPISVNLDLFLGALPAFGILCLSLIGLLLDLNFLKDGWNQPGPLGIFAVAIGSTGGSLTLLYTTFARAKTKNKAWCIFGLTFGISCSVLLVYFFVMIFLIPTNSNEFLVLLTSATVFISLTALKHIYLLNRGQPA
jgi:hypothetical protein